RRRHRGSRPLVFHPPSSIPSLRQPPCFNPILTFPLFTCCLNLVLICNPSSNASRQAALLPRFDFAVGGNPNPKTVLLLVAIHPSWQADSPSQVSPKMSPQAAPASPEMEPLEPLRHDAAEPALSSSKEPGWVFLVDPDDRPPQYNEYNSSMDEKEAAFDALSYAVPSTASSEPGHQSPFADSPRSWAPVSDPNLRTISPTPFLERPMFGHPTWSFATGLLLSLLGHLRQMATPTSRPHGRPRVLIRPASRTGTAGLRRQGTCAYCEHAFVYKGQGREPSSSGHDDRQLSSTWMFTEIMGPGSEAVWSSTTLATATAMVDQFFRWLDVLRFITNQAKTQSGGGAELDDGLSTGDSTDGDRLLPARCESAQDSSSSVGGNGQVLVMAC
ncbi:hypothetical protein QBC47DRAFT_32417, partial [Echria macrotheca]